MKIGIIIDATCDLSTEFIRKHEIGVIPIHITDGNKYYLDKKEDSEYEKFYDLIKKNSTKLSTMALSSNEIKKALLNENILKCNEYICILPSKTHSDSYQNTLIAITKHNSDIRNYRQQHGINQPVKIHAIDAGQLSCGLSIIVENLIHNINIGMPPEIMIQDINELSKNTQSFLFPKSIQEIYKNGSTKGDRSLNLKDYLLGSALDIKPIIFGYRGNTELIAKAKGFENGLKQIIEIVKKQINNNRLLINHISTSYGGDFDEIRNEPEWVKLEDMAKSKSIVLTLNKMSPTLMVNVGVGAFGLSFISEKIYKI